MNLPDSLRRFLHTRRFGLLAILLAFPVQSFYEYRYCGGGPLGLWLNTAVLMAVPALMLAWPRSSPAAVSALVILGFCLWANSMECAPPTDGGGAPMAYVLAFFYGVPAALAAGMATGFATARAARRGPPTSAGR